MKQVYLLAEGAEALLEHHGKAQRPRRLGGKARLGIAHGGKGLGGEDGARHGDSRPPEPQPGQRLVVAGEDRRGAVKHPHTHLFQLPGKLHVLVPEQHKVQRLRREGARGDVAAQLRVGADVQLHPLPVRGGEQSVIQVVKLGGAQKGVDHHQPMEHRGSSLTFRRRAPAQPRPAPPARRQSARRGCPPSAARC